MSEHTGASYESIASKYAATVDTKPWNAYYERPAMVSLFPSLANAKVLDVGCGSGWYAEYLLSCGATVTAFDFNAEFVALTRTRVDQHATVLQADLANSLAFAEDGEYDAVICPLVMHYLRDWQPTFREFHRLLKPGGVLLFSTHHPFADWQDYNTEDYFAVALLEDEWDEGKVRFYRRPLTVMSQDLDATGFCIERLLEPQPTEDFRLVHPEGYNRLTKSPGFLVIRARKKIEVV